MSATREQIKHEIDLISAVDLAWAAGLFEGEGCFSVSRTQTGRPHLDMRLAMKDEDIVKRFHSIATFGSCYFKVAPSLSSPLWEWHASRWRAEHFGWALCKHLGTRRRNRFLEILQEVRAYDN